MPKHERVIDFLEPWRAEDPLDREHDAEGWTLLRDASRGDLELEAQKGTNGLLAICLQVREARGPSMARDVATCQVHEGWHQLADLDLRGGDAVRVLYREVGGHTEAQRDLKVLRLRLQS